MPVSFLVFQPEAILEGAARRFSQNLVDVLDGVKGDGLKPGGSDSAVLVQGRFAGADAKGKLLVIADA